jgi:hypothetical protein
MFRKVFYRRWYGVVHAISTGLYFTCPFQKAPTQARLMFRQLYMFCGEQVISPSIDCLDTPPLLEAKTLYQKHSKSFGKVFPSVLSPLDRTR